VRNFKFYLLAFLLPLSSYAQECFNAGLEDGTLSGYNTYRGQIQEDGTVIIENPALNENQHRVMHISEGFDPIAALHCTLNNMLPVVPQDGGQYTLRLGNSQSGSQAERVVLRFTVTPELTFFLLRYAVILNDPDHAAFEQPRFELRILDENGGVFPCGEYQVRAAENIPGFESCTSGWRVRPWTTVGFELQSFLGQEIQIEILTTDCSQGGHAGYAYLDVTCQPLEIKLEGYCPGNTDATMRVTDGFVDYQWNTGERTNAINIQDPLPGTNYQVTVTSATGCTLVLESTIPDLEEIPSPVFAAEPNLTFCRDTAFWFQPKGEYLNEIFSPTLDHTADSFLLNTLAHNYFSFVATDKYGCSSDSLQFSLNIAPPTIEHNIENPVCAGEANGKIEITVQSDFMPINYRWNTGNTTSDLSNLVAGDYTVTIIDNLNCTSTENFTLSEPPLLTLEVIETSSIICAGNEDAVLEIFVAGGVAPYVYELNNQQFSLPFMDNLAAGTYSILVNDLNSCVAENIIQIEEPLPMNVEAFTRPVNCYGGIDGEINLTIQGGMPTYNIAWNDARYNGQTSMQKMGAGTYTATITDALGCEMEETVTVFQPPFNKDCGTYIPNAFSPNGDGNNDVFYVAGSNTGVAVEKMEIYNRWGELVFTKADDCIAITNTDCGWTGSMQGNNAAPVGTYLYLISILFEGVSKPVLFTGDVQPLR